MTKQPNMPTGPQSADQPETDRGPSKSAISKLEAECAEKAFEPPDFRAFTKTTGQING